MPSIIGYARTSTIDQKAGLEAQERDLKVAGCTALFTEQVSSVENNRVKLAMALAAVGKGDTLMVTKPDRLARSTLDLLRIVADLDARGASLIILSMGGERLDTRNPTSKLMLTILAGVATWEREIMLERQREGIAKAKANGAYAERRKPGRLDSVAAMMAQNISAREISKREGIHYATACRTVNLIKAQQNATLLQDAAD